VVTVFLLWLEIGYLGRYVGIFFYKRSEKGPPDHACHSKCYCSSSTHQVSSIFATYVGIHIMFLREIHVGINLHRQDGIF
jgi:hypothetical protein